MPTVTYSFDVGQTVFCVDKSFGVKEAVVKEIDIVVKLPTLIPLVEYTVQYVNTATGSAVFPETVIFADVDSALTAFRTIVLGGN